MYTLEQLKKASLSWPSEVIDQLNDENFQNFLKDKHDWLNMNWTKKTVTDLSIKSNNIDTIKAMMVSNQFEIAFFNMEKDFERHEYSRKDLLENGTWSKPLIMVSTSDGWELIDGFHRVAQFLAISSLFHQVSQLHPVNRIFLYKEFHQLNYVNKLNNTHEIWLAEPIQSVA